MNKHIEDKFQQWINTYEPGDQMLWKGAWWEQVSFVRDELRSLINTGLPYDQTAASLSVLSTHTSKSIVLPVYDFVRPDVGLRLIARNNFYNWKLSVISTRPVEADFTELFFTDPPPDPAYTGNPLSPVYFEGFPKELVFSYYGTSDKKTWSAEIHNNERLWTTVFLILRSLDAVPAKVWGIRKVQP